MNTDRKCPSDSAQRPAVARAGLRANSLLRLAEFAEAAPPETTEADLAVVMHRQTTSVGLQFYAIGDYQLEGELARGGMGLVFRAWQNRLKRHVALKLLLPDQLDSASRVRRFRIEAEATARLEHPHIVPIYEIGEFAGQHFLCMKLIQGETLGRVLARERFDPRRTCEFVVTLAEAVHYAHQRGVLHRDLKPGNILVDEFGQPQVTDFGLARLLERDSELTRPDAVIGTPAYMAPEQAVGRTNDLTLACDIYSLGAILYEMLTGRTPFQSDSTLDMLRQVRECEPTPPRNLDPKIPLDLDTVCRKCLRKEPRDRYPTAQALADDLRRFLRREPVLARPLTPLARAALWCRRNPGTTSLLAGILALWILFTGAALFVRAQDLRDNQSFARLVAEGIAAGLAAVGRSVEQEAASLGALLATQSGAVSEALCTNQLRRLMERPAPSPATPGNTAWASIANWVWMDSNGITLGRWPPVAPEKRKDNRSERNYFWGALNAYRQSGRADYYVSAVYDSEEDQLRKLGVSVVLKGAEPGEVLGVLTAMVHTTSRNLAASFDIHHHETVVVARTDPSTRAAGTESRSPEPGSSWLIHLHPSAPDNRTNTLAFPEKWITRTNLNFYFDPARREDPIRGWIPWMVGLEPVQPPVPAQGLPREGIKLVVLVQSRDWIVVFLIPGLLLTAALIGVAGWRLRRKQETR